MAKLRLLLIAFVAVAAVGCSSSPVQPKAPTVMELDEAAVRAKTYLVGALNDDGSFVYRRNLDSGISVPPSYNLLRHAGAIYSLAMYEDAYGDDSTVPTMVQAAKFLHATLGPIPGQENMLAVWSDPKLIHSDKELTAKLGGTGLGLIALLMTERHAPGTTPQDTLTQMGNFLLFMQRPDGGFVSRFRASIGKDFSWHSQYYPGEAALALVMLYEQTEDARYLKAAAESLAYMAQIRFGQPVVAADHWALLATERVLTHQQVLGQKPSKDLLIAHGAQITDSILVRRYSYPPDTVFHGALGGQARTTPTATRLEGLLAAYEFLPPQYGELRTIVEEVASDSVAFLVRSQVKKGEYVGAIPRAIKPMGGEGEDVEKFNRRVGEVRIDYVQHALSAMLQYRDMLLAENQSAP